MTGNSEIIARYINKNGQIEIWPSKRNKRIDVLRYFISKLEKGRFYTEHEMNDLICEWFIIQDYPTVRRTLIDHHLLSRTNDGTIYWINDRANLNHICIFLSEHYHIGGIHSLMQMNNGIGSNSYFVAADEGLFIFKDIEKNHMNYPENESNVLSTLHNDGLPVPQILQDIDGRDILCLDNNKCHLQTFLRGRILDYNTLEDHQLYQVARMLGKIQLSLTKSKDLPAGIGAEFFKRFTPDAAIEAHEATMCIAYDNEDILVAEIMKEKIQMIERFRGLSFDFTKITALNTHGDYTTDQILFSDGEITGVIDFTSACIHPACWELLRSYLHAEPTVKQNVFDTNKWKRYVNEYENHIDLNAYDKEIAIPLYIYQNLLAEYFVAYYHTTFRNRHILYNNALRNHMHTKLLVDCHCRKNGPHQSLGSA